MKCSPFIIFSDMLMIFMSMFMLQSSLSIEYQIPDNKLFDGGKIISLNEESSFVLQDGKWIEATKQIMGDEFVGSVKCVQSFCENIQPARKGDELRVAFAGELLSNIAKLSYFACNYDASSCGNLLISIKENGTLDLQKIVQDNPIFSNIQGIEYLFNKTNI